MEGSFIYFNKIPVYEFQKREFYTEELEKIKF